MDRWTDRQTNNNIHKHPWMLSVSHLDTSACQIVGHFFQALCMQYTNPSPWMVGRTNAWNDNNTHRHQCWPRVSHLETSAFLTLCHSFLVTCQQMCKNLKMWLTDCKFWRSLSLAQICCHLMFFIICINLCSNTSVDIMYNLVSHFTLRLFTVVELNLCCHCLLVVMVASLFPLFLRSRVYY